MAPATQSNALRLCAAILGLLVGAERAASAQDLVAASAPSGGQVVLRILDLADGSHKPYMTLPVPADYAYLRMLSPLPGNRLLAGFYHGTANFTGRFFKIDPLAGTSEELILGAPLGSRYIEAMEWSPRHNAILLSHAPLGNFGTSSIAIVDESGAVLGNAVSSPTQSDLDHVACSDTSDVFIDLNRVASNRVVQLATTFPAPTFSNLASPPSMTDFHDITFEPGTGRLLLANGAGTTILHINGNVYTAVTTLQGGLSVRAISFASIPPRIQQQPADTSTCPGGTLTLSIDSSGGLPTHRWQRLIGGDWTDLFDGATGTGSTIVGAATAELTIHSMGFPDNGQYRCVLSDNAAPDGIESIAASAQVCLSNYNCDGLVDILDFLDFIDDFGACDSQPGPCGTLGDADVNGDTFVDILDFLDFIDAFGSGC